MGKSFVSIIMNMLSPNLRVWVRKNIGPLYRSGIKCFYLFKKAFFENKASVPTSSKDYLELGRVCYRLSQLEEAIECFEKAIKLDSSNFEAYVQLELMLRLNGQTPKEDAHGHKIHDTRTYDLDKSCMRKVLDCCDRMVENFPDLHQAHFKLGNALITAKGDQKNAIRSFYQATKLRMAEIRSRGEAGIIFCASMPRSSSGFTQRSLEAGLNIPKDAPAGIEVTCWGFPHETLILPPEYATFDYPIPNKVVISDPTPTEPNMKTLNMAVDRVLVNVRDPRQALLSWVHYMNYFRFTNNIEGMMEIDLAENYYEMSLQEQIGWQVDNFYLPEILKWIESWMDAAEDPLFYPEILFIQFESLLADQKAHFDRILDFYGFDKEKFIYPKQPKFKHHTHMRKGRVDEWREVFTSEQADKATRMIPQKMVTKFGWSNDPSTVSKKET